MFGGKGIGLFNGGPVHADSIVSIGLVADFLEPESALGLPLLRSEARDLVFCPAATVMERLSGLNTKRGEATPWPLRLMRVGEFSAFE